ncbi:hypothetical protein Tco_0038353 [Tanacetum coccineum]
MLMAVLMAFFYSTNEKVLGLALVCFFCEEEESIPHGSTRASNGEQVETPENPFVAPANIYTIEVFMNRVGYQGIVDKRIDEDYHSIKDDIPLIRETNNFKEYETVFMKSSGVEEEEANCMKSSSPRKSLKITIKQKQIVEKDDDDSKERIEPRSHKDNPEVVDEDDDDKEIETKDDEMGSLEIRNEETLTKISTPLSFLRKILSSDKKTSQELMDIVSYPTTTTSKHSQVKKRISSKDYHILGALRRMCRRQADDIALWEALRHKFEKSSTSNTSCREDDFHSHHDEHQDDDAPLEGEKRVKRSKMTKRSKYARDNVVDEDEVISKDVTPELIVEFQNVNKRVPIIFDHARMEATLRDSLSNLSRNAEENPNEPPRALYNKDLFFLKYGNTEEKKYILSLHKIHAKEFPEPDLEEKLN